MLAGRDSAYAPTDAQLDAFYAQGVRVFGGYIKLGNDGIYHGWSQTDFARVKAHGFVPIAYMSGWDDPAQARATAASWGVAIVIVDIESGIRPDGTWAQGWINTAQAGEYGNLPVQYHTAPIHEDAGYPGSDPRATWPAGVARPAGICGWQWQGSHAENGLTVDSAWWDDSIARTYGTSSGALYGPAQLRNTEDSGIAILFHPTQVDRMDVLVIGTDQAVYHFWGTTDALTAGTSGHEGWGGSFVPGTLSAAWYNDPQNVRLVCQAVDASGVVQIREVDTSGVVVREWTPLKNGSAVLKVALPSAAPDDDPAPIPGPPGQEGPTGPEGPQGVPGVSPDPSAVEGDFLSRLFAALKKALGL